uniref:Helicase ATP-binding domain-containing protein n=1 Tax=Periophthalmus magnuspinnatus TaxID=409849 RepID=A0A3B4A8S9_9GOBI
MLDSDDCTLSQDNLFFEKPIVHKTSQWQVEMPPSLSQIPGTQDMQEEAFSFSHGIHFFLTHMRWSVSVFRNRLNNYLNYLNIHSLLTSYILYYINAHFMDILCKFFIFLAGLSQAPQQKKFVPPFKRSSDLNILPSISKLSYNLNIDEHETKVFYTGRNFVASAPTGSGKTVLFELAIIRQLMETSEPWADFKAVYMAPIKALCSQCFENWKRKFGPLGLKCKELTGDTEIDDFFEIQDSHVILTTPEKWDSMTRKWKDNCLLELVRLFLIDEVHVVKDATRGATLEVVVSRMKTVNAYRSAQNPEGAVSMRFVAVSATIPNITDVRT